MTYDKFTTYPINILGINESYNNELTAIETLVKTEIAYTGDAADISGVIPYFVFFKFCENRASEVTANNGEQMSTAEFTFPSVLSQVRAWNLGAVKLLSICTEKVETANINYQSQRELI
jgi:hypothetical protein